MDDQVVDAEVIPDLTHAEARALTKKIKACAEQMWDLIIQAYLGRVWLAYGHRDWHEYCAKEFSGCRMKIPAPERGQIHLAMRKAGLSIRAINAATGYSINTIRQDLKRCGVQVYQTATPDEEPPIDEVTPVPLDDDERAASAAIRTWAKKHGHVPSVRGQIPDHLELDNAEPPLSLNGNKTIVGTDGKKYNSTQPKPKPKPTNTYVNRFYRALSVLQEDALKLEILCNEKGFAESHAQVCGHRDGVVWVQEIIARVLDKLHTDQTEMF
jgi:hypothetical protein